MHTPLNYRKHFFHLFGKDMDIAGLAGPHNNPNEDEVFNFLSNVEKRKVLIGLHEDNNFTTKAKNHGMIYYHRPMRDLSALRAEPEVYDEIYNIVKKETAEGNLISIHCGSGDGRTGTTLAALKLRELLEAAAMKDPKVLSRKLNYSYPVEASDDGLIQQCTAFVKAAIEEVRKNRNAESGLAGSKSVETRHDVLALMDYEEYLRIAIKKNLEKEGMIQDEPSFSFRF